MRISVGFLSRISAPVCYPLTGRSDIIGTRERTREGVELPSLAWVWDDDWHIDTTFNGVQLEMGGWTYAVDFPAEYHPKKGFTSCVRRHRWI